MKPRIELLVLGHVTRDEVGADVRWGGAAAYSALAAARLGVATGLVTAAPPDSPLLEELRAEPRLVLHLVPSPVFTSFVVDYSGPERTLWLRDRAPDLRLQDIPPAFARARTVYIGPVAGECSSELVRACAQRGAAFVGLGLQGWLRAFEPASESDPSRRRVAPGLDASILEVPGVGAVAVSELDHPAVTAHAARLADRGATVAVTHGARGASLFHAHARVDIPAAPADERDPTGAGDVFGVVFTLRLADGASVREAGLAAAEAAARVVEGPGLGTLPRASSVEAFSAGTKLALETGEGA